MNFHALTARIRPATVWPPVDRLDGLASLAAIALVAMAAASKASDSRDDPRRAAGARAPSLVLGAARPPLARETMLAAYSGAPYTYPSDVTIRKPGVHDLGIRGVTWDGKPFRNPIYYGARLARWFEGGAFGAMADFTHSKTIARLAEEAALTGLWNGAPTPSRAVLGTMFHKLEFSHGHNILTLNGLMRLPGLTASLFPYVGLGGGVALPHTEVHAAGAEARTYEYQFAALTGQALAGLEFRLPGVSLFVEYKFSLAPYRVPLSERDSRATAFEDLWLQWRSWLGGEEPPGGVLATTLASHQIISGIGVRIGNPRPAVAP